jgi:3-hydroxybutyryl-CoA dehydrogenase
MNPTFPTIAVIGAGAMGRGIAQIAAQAGSLVRLVDNNPQASLQAKAALAEQWDKLAAKGKLEPSQAQACKDRIAVATLQDLSDCTLVVEAIVERLDVKQALFAQLEDIVAPTAVLATNTSSLSVTAIGAGLKRPAQLAGFHFFNPVPLMKVVEVICGIKTDPGVAQALARFAREMGHTPVQASDTPGFIVNHAGRGYNTEALRIVSEGVADFATIDRILRDQVGFRLGPFELMDLTALDVSHPVMESIYNQYYQEPRYRPSVITAQRLAGGVLGRKTGQGFYVYSEGKAQIAAEPPAPEVADMPPVWVSTRAARRAELLQSLPKAVTRRNCRLTPMAEILALRSSLLMTRSTMCPTVQQWARTAVTISAMARSRFPSFLRIVVAASKSRNFGATRCLVTALVMPTWHMRAICCGLTAPLTTPWIARGIMGSGPLTRLRISRRAKQNRR